MLLHKPGIYFLSVFCCLVITLCLANVGSSEQNLEYEAQRKRMVEKQLKARDIDSPEVLDAMQKVRRHLFVPERVRHLSYRDRPLPIGHGQTISQPYIVALMTQLANIKKGDRILEIGTGSGYQAAILARLGEEVYSVEIIPELARKSGDLLQELGYTNVDVRSGDGFKGWPEHAPFDCIIVTCAPSEIPEPLLQQLAAGGRLVIPVGEHRQKLKLVQKGKDGEVEEKNIIPVRFVPMTGFGVSGSDK